MWRNTHKHVSFTITSSSCGSLPLHVKGSHHPSPPIRPSPPPSPPCHLLLQRRRRAIHVHHHLHHPTEPTFRLKLPLRRHYHLIHQNNLPPFPGKHRRNPSRRRKHRQAPFHVALRAFHACHQISPASLRRNAQESSASHVHGLRWIPMVDTGLRR